MLLMPAAVWVLPVLCVCLPHPGTGLQLAMYSHLPLPVPGLQRRQSVLGFPTDGGRPHTL